MLLKENLTSIVLAGGKSLRLGRDKVWERLGQETLIERVVRRLKPLSAEIIIVTAQGKRIPFLDENYNARVVYDLYPGKGSLGGIYTGLSEASFSHSLAVACDMPFLNIPLLRHMIEISSDFDVVIPRVKGKLEPLHAIYSKNCIGPIDTLLKRDQLRIVTFLNDVSVRYLDEETIEPFDPDYLSFFNINTEADLMRGRLLVEEERSLEPELRTSSEIVDGG